MRASDLLKTNIETLLAARKQTKHELARYCRRSDAWLSKILGGPDRNLPLKYLDQLADFFGLVVYQLFQPGISPLSERRRGKERRVLTDRRMSARNRSLPRTPVRGLELSPDEEAFLAEIKSLTHEEYQRVKHWVHITKLGRK